MGLAGGRKEGDGAAREEETCRRQRQNSGIQHKGKRRIHSNTTEHNRERQRAYLVPPMPYSQNSYKTPTTPQTGRNALSPPSPYTQHPAYHPSPAQSTRRYNRGHKSRQLQFTSSTFGTAHDQEREYHSLRMPPKHCRQGRRRGTSVSFLPTVLAMGNQVQWAGSRSTILPTDVHGYEIVRNRGGDI
jgi:hypothetical protein